MALLKRQKWINKKTVYDIYQVVSSSTNNTRKSKTFFIQGTTLSINLKKKKSKLKKKICYISANICITDFVICHQILRNCAKFKSRLLLQQHLSQYLPSEMICLGQKMTGLFVSWAATWHWCKNVLADLSSRQQLEITADCNSEISIKWFLHNLLYSATSRQGLKAARLAVAELQSTTEKSTSFLKN